MLNDISSVGRIFLWGEGGRGGGGAAHFESRAAKGAPRGGDPGGVWGRAPTAGGENFFNLHIENNWKPLRNLWKDPFFDNR